MNSETENLFICGNYQKNRDGNLPKKHLLELLSNCDCVDLPFHHQYSSCLLFAGTEDVWQFIKHS